MFKRGSTYFALLGGCTCMGTATSTSFWPTFEGHLSPVPPHTRFICATPVTMLTGCASLPATIWCDRFGVPGLYGGGVAALTAKHPLGPWTTMTTTLDPGCPMAKQTSCFEVGPPDSNATCAPVTQAQQNYVIEVPLVNGSSAWVWTGDKCTGNTIITLPFCWSECHRFRCPPPQSSCTCPSGSAIMCVERVS